MNKPYVIRFSIDDRPQKWVRYNAKGMEAALKDARAAVSREWPGSEVSKLRITDPAQTGEKV